jgi:hypothetical protein
MRAFKGLALVALAVALLAVAGPAQADEFKLNLSGATYTKWLWGTMHEDGSMYNWTSTGEGYGDNGQGSELELFIDAKVSPQVSVHARIHSRFSQNEWTNFGGWGNPGGATPAVGNCVGGSCGEYDPRSNQYIKLRGVAVTFTPGYKWMDTAVIGASDWGMFDPFVVGRIRYIDRDNAAGLLFQGSANHKAFTWDFARISLPRLWAGPNWSTGTYAGSDAAYAFQFKITPSPEYDIAGIADYVNDQEVDATDTIWDNGRDVRTRFRNTVLGAKVGFHPSSVVDLRGQYYASSVDSVVGQPNVPTSFGYGGYSPVIAGRHDGSSWKGNLDLNDPFGTGFSFYFEGFKIGKTFASMMAARRESDVLLTEGHDAAFYYPGPSNQSYGVFGFGAGQRPDYGGWDGNFQQVATINVDNEFTDFDEPQAESAIGWKGYTFVPKYAHGALELSGEYTHLDYDTNWQAWGNLTRAITDTDYPMMDGATGVGSFRAAYAPFQDKKTDIALIKGKYLLDVGKGVDIFFKVKSIGETDNRLNDPKFLPFAAGDCPGSGQACKNVKNYYVPGLTTANADQFGNPPVITVTNPDGSKSTGYQWKPWTSITDDDRDLKYYMFQLGAGYQLTNDLYGSLSYEYYHADLKDGNTAFQAYNVNEMMSGMTKKHMAIARFNYTLGGANVGFEYQYNWGTFEPDFGTGYVVQYADAGTASSKGVNLGSRGFAGRYGGWNSLETRNFNQARLKAFLKVQF